MTFGPQKASLGGLGLVALYGIIAAFSTAENFCNYITFLAGCMLGCHQELQKMLGGIGQGNFRKIIRAWLSRV